MKPLNYGISAFLTGSYAYGTPRETSDVDLVVLGDNELREFLKNHDDQRSYSIRYGNLNLICCTSLNEFKAWRDGTIQLCGESPVTRDRAVEVLRAIRKERGVNRS